MPLWPHSLSAEELSPCPYPDANEISLQTSRHPCFRAASLSASIVGSKQRGLLMQPGWKTDHTCLILAESFRLRCHFFLAKPAANQARQVFGISPCEQRL